MKPRLCLFTDSLEPSGVGEHMLLLADELKTQYRVAFACPPSLHGKPFLERAAHWGLQTFELRVAQGATQAYNELENWLQSQGTEIFHGHAGIGWEGHDAVLTARRAGVPCIVRTEHLPHLITEEWQQCEHAELMQCVDRLICVSGEARRSFLQAGIATSQVQTVRNGIRAPRDLHSVSSLIRAELKLKSTDKIALTVGRMTEQKGYRYLLDAVHRVLEGAPQTHFLWVGEGELSGELQARVSECRLGNYIHFLGRRGDVPQLLAACDVFVLPSLFEGLPLVVLEAMAMGVPVVGTRVCGTSEAIADGETGRLVNPRDALSLANGILEVLENPRQAARWGATGRKRFEREFSANRMAHETSAIYQDVLQRHASNRVLESAVVSGWRLATA